MKIQEVLALADGFPVVDLRCRVKKAFPPKRGESAKGPWCVMNLILTDDTGEMRASWWSPTTEDHREIEGQDVEISARKNSKNVLSGVKVEHKEYEGKQQVQVSINGNNLRAASDGIDSTSDQTRPAAQANQQRPGLFSDAELIEASRRWAAGFREALADPSSLDKVPYEILGPLVSTLLIAATNGRIVIKPVGAPAPKVEPPKKEEAPPWDEEDPLGGALDD